MTLGAVGGATASWLAWQTTVDLPSDTAALQTAETVGGAPLTTPAVHRFDSARTFWHGVTVSAEQQLSVPDWSVDDAQARLRADGRTSGPDADISPSSQGDERREEAVEGFQATRGSFPSAASLATAAFAFHQFSSNGCTSRAMGQNPSVSS